MDLNLFELYFKLMTAMYFILFYLNLWLNIYLLNNFVIPAGTRGYEKIDGYPHNRYQMDMGTGTGQIFI